MRCVTPVLKLLLCILIIFCGAVIGLHFSQRLIRRRDVLQGFDKLFHRAMIQIAYNAGNLCEVFSENFADHPFSHSVPFDVQWLRFIDSFRLILSKDDLDVLSDFTKGLGAADCASQQRHITLYVRLLQEHIESAQEDIRTKSKMYRLVPLSAGIVIALMMI